jgi:hypothetical protein
MNFVIYKGYKEPVVHKVNKGVIIALYKAINKKDKDIIDIYNIKYNTYISLYYTTIKDIYSLLNKKLYNKSSPKGSPLKKRKLFQNHANLIF